MARRGPQRRPLRKRLWSGIKRLLRIDGPDWEPPDWRPEEPALVPVGPPRGPRPSSSVALELPEEPQNVDAFGREPE